MRGVCRVSLITLFLPNKLRPEPLMYVVLIWLWFCVFTLWLVLYLESCHGSNYVQFSIISIDLHNILPGMCNWMDLNSQQKIKKKKTKALGVYSANTMFSVDTEILQQTVGTITHSGIDRVETDVIMKKVVIHFYPSFPIFLFLSPLPSPLSLLLFSLLSWSRPLTLPISGPRAYVSLWSLFTA